MGGLFNGLLDISRLDAGVVEVNRADVSRMQPLLERICRDYAGDAEAKQPAGKGSRVWLARRRRIANKQ